MSVHKNARLTAHSRAELVWRVVDDGQPPKAVAAAFVAVGASRGLPDVPHRAAPRSCPRQQMPPAQRVNLVGKGSRFG
jgi:hypothetical protein